MRLNDNNIKNNDIDNLNLSLFDNYILLRKIQIKFYIKKYMELNKKDLNKIFLKFDNVQNLNKLIYTNKNIKNEIMFVYNNKESILSLSSINLLFIKTQIVEDNINFLNLLEISSNLNLFDWKINLDLLQQKIFKQIAKEIILIKTSFSDMNSFNKSFKLINKKLIEEDI